MLRGTIHGTALINDKPVESMAQSVGATTYTRGSGARLRGCEAANNLQG